MRQSARGRLATVALCGLLGTVAGGCGMPATRIVSMSTGGPGGTSAGVSVLGSQQQPTVDAAVSEPSPGHLAGPVRRADLLVVAGHTLPRQVRRQVATAPGVRSSMPLSMASAPVDGRTITIAAADLSAYRRFTPQVTAGADAVWQRVAEGDLAVTPQLADQLHAPLGGHLRLGNEAGALTLRIGATASMPPKIDAVVNQPRARQLGMVPDNAVVVSTRGEDPAAVASTLRKRIGSAATVAQLTENVPEQGRQTAFLTGGSVADAVGSFTYRWFPDGTVAPDPAWTAANLRTERVPILGAVTCHRVMLPQLRAALQEVVDSGLGHLVDPSDYGGCYSPRFIDHDPAKGLSLHTWGIAVDLNVQSNLRGTPGHMDPRIVAIFKKWGFAWGGDWHYTDPMHFELAALVRPR